MKGQPIFVAMQAEGREWTQMFSRRAAALFDYIFTDSMTWTDNHGRRMRLWIPEEVGTIADPQEFMDTLVDRTVGILDHEPVDIYANPTYLPDHLAKDYETLWTEARRKKVVDAAVRNGVAIEINNRYQLPSPSFIKMAKAAGCKFTFGTNNTGPETSAAANTACAWSRNAIWSGRISSCPAQPPKPSSAKAAPSKHDRRCPP